MSQVHVSQHPLVLHKLTALRDKDTDHRAFRELVRELALLLCYEATQDLELTPKKVMTPMGEANGHKADLAIGLVPVLRAGLGLVEGRDGAAAECAGVAHRFVSRRENAATG